MNTYKIDFASKTLTITKAFAEAAADPNSEEYKLMKTFQQDIPNLTIVQRTHKTPTKYHTKSGEILRCNQYKHLTYENMEHFIGLLPNSKEVMKVYEYLRYGFGGVQTSTYARVSDWFMRTFPLYRKNPLFYLENAVKVIDLMKHLPQQQELDA